MKKISQRDIAKSLGVNVSSVSRALKGQKGVSEELRQKIERMAAENGYQPMDFAAAEHYDATRIIGIVVPDMSYNLYAHIVKWIESEARKSGYMSIVTDTCDRYDYEVESLERLVEMHVSGIIVSLSQETRGRGQRTPAGRTQTPRATHDTGQHAEYPLHCRRRI